jgi:nucleoid-associated protein YgaU
VAIIEPKKEPAKVVTAPAVKKEGQPVVKTEVASLERKSAPAPLRTGSSVIIRKGDSLWRISYRTYGRGVRYSTIYQANLRQLKNPHRIYPGQILKLPKKNFDQNG